MRNCPNCNNLVGRGAFDHSVHECKNCGQIFCSACSPKADGIFTGAECPECHSVNTESVTTKYCKD